MLKQRLEASFEVVGRHGDNGELRGYRRGLETMPPGRSTIYNELIVDVNKQRAKRTTNPPPQITTLEDRRLWPYFV